MNASPSSCEPVEPLCSAIEELRTIRRTALLALIAGLGTLAAIWFALAVWSALP